MAPQSMGTNGPRARGEASCTARAATSLPVPVSPWMRSVESDDATRSSTAYTARISRLLPTRSPNEVAAESAT